MEKKELVVTFEPYPKQEVLELLSKCYYRTVMTEKMGDTGIVTKVTVECYDKYNY